MATIASMHMYGFSLQPRLCSTGGRPAKITRTKPLATHDSSAHIPPRFKELQQVLKTKLREASAAGSSASKKLLDAFVDSIFTFSHQSLRPTESNFAPVEEIGQITNILRIEGAIPEDFPEGVYIRNGKGGGKVVTGRNIRQDIGRTRRWLIGVTVAGSCSGGNVDLAESMQQRRQWLCPEWL
nr:uncharacterized protein LOC4345406 isoform X2 [Oryza sativa Japonica Group]